MAAGEHTAEDIADLLEERFAFWGINGKVYATISDNSQNMVKALGDIMTIPVFFGCFAHTVNLAVEKGFKCARVNLLLTCAWHDVDTSPTAQRQPIFCEQCRQTQENHRLKCWNSSETISLSGHVSLCHDQASSTSDRCRPFCAV